MPLLCFDKFKKSSRSRIQRVGPLQSCFVNRTIFAVVVFLQPLQLCPGDFTGQGQTLRIIGNVKCILFPTFESTILVDLTTAQNGDSAGVFTAIDEDEGDTHSYGIQSDTTNGAFAIDGASGDELIIADVNKLIEGDMVVVIRSTDAGGLYVDKSFTIEGVTSNSAPTDIAL